MIEDAISELPGPLQMFMRFEQRHLWKAERFREPLADSALKREYLPESGGVFRLPCFIVPRKHLYLYGQLDDHWLDARGGDAGVHGSVLFPVHPAEVQHYVGLMSRLRAHYGEEEGLRIWATPTSSTRTVLAWPFGKPEEARFVKLSLGSRILGDRRMTRRKIALSVGLSDLVHRSRLTLPFEIQCLPEPFGMTPRGLQDSGVLFRTIPRELGGDVILAPLFALVGGSDEHHALLLQLAERDSVGALRIVEEVLLARFARLWVDLVFDHGLILEAHGQDLLLALSRELVPLGGFYYRDFEGLAVDWALRRQRGFPDPALPNSFEWFSTYETWGHRLYQLISIKLITSLFGYVHLVLADLESALLGWQRNGVVLGEGISEGELTSRFSQYLRKAIQEKFGMREPREYDIRNHLKRFAKFLMEVRREVMRASGGAC